ncbi:hypothetical protein [Leptospira weilii]|uniref:Phage tail collar domain protein n=1 Tax=Leptospira weilii str. UI 13098 TaxID=1088542 RepID=M6QNY8_9LEPT|nr:hypothetical protein [Leptospira weilii]EMN90572.1 hypothetical protein LEP1GSC108_2803 [Leptospira weilii str. UI 13098]
MSWTQVDANKYESSSGWTIELDGGYGWIMYHEEIEDELPDTFFVLADLFGNPGQAVVTVDPLTGKIPTGLIPSLAISEVFVTSSETQMLALNCQKGDIAIRTDIPGPAMFILALDDSTALSSWVSVTVTYPDWANIRNKPLGFPPESHNHDSRYYTKSETDSALSQNSDWNNIQNKPPVFPPENHNHDSRYYTKSETDSALSQNSDWNNIRNKPPAFPPENHNHNSSYYTKTETDSALSQKRDVGNISATDIIEDSSHRFVSDMEKAAIAGGGFSIPLGGILEDALDQLPSSNFKETNGQAISRITFSTLWNLVHRTVTSIAPATDRINVAAHGCAEGQLIKFAFTGGGITALTNYYVRNPTLNDFQISLNPTGGVINLTSSQSGDFVINVEYDFGNGTTTFNVPDRRGIFPRGTGVHGSRAKTSGGNYDGGSVGFAGQDRQIPHRHQQYAGDIAGGSYGSGGRYADSGGASAATILYTGSPVSDGTGNPRNGNEVAPAWVAVKYKLRVL